jgi:hypothetical protein
MGAACFERQGHAGKRRSHVGTTGAKEGPPVLLHAACNFGNEGCVSCNPWDRPSRWARQWHASAGRSWGS